MVNCQFRACKKFKSRFSNKKFQSWKAKSVSFTMIFKEDLTQQQRFEGFQPKLGFMSKHCVQKQRLYCHIIRYQVSLSSQVTEPITKSMSSSLLSHWEIRLCNRDIRNHVTRMIKSDAILGYIRIGFL